ncbi:hypothetical protein A9264_14250 [Vibrio sp. UCD-FRSSP16_10]|nr:hypothetical protein A9260_14630 [Vibrio sp. UCD-FRSSP16_30]OBT19639.1 hypothetical protein A9264_14250 [Vibrio sp. UCD-FRSSP16_10]
MQASKIFVQLILLLMTIIVLSPLAFAQQKSAEQLSYIAQDKSNNKATRIEAFQQLATLPSQSALIAVARGLKDPQHEIRLAAVEASTLYSFTHRWRLLSPLMSDLVFDVRGAVVENLVVDYPQMNAVQKQQFLPLFNDWTVKMEQNNSNESLLKAGHGYSAIEDYDSARRVYRQIIEHCLPNKYSDEIEQAWVGISETYRLENKDQQALSVLEDVLQSVPDEPQILYLKALALVRLSLNEQAAEVMNTAANIAEDNSHYWYVNGILQDSVNKDEAKLSLKKAYQLSNSSEHLYALCDFKIRHSDNHAKQCVMQLKSVAPAPVINDLMSRIDNRNIVAN